MLITLGKQAKIASYTLAGLDTEMKNKALFAMADALIAHSGEIIAANVCDMANGEKNGAAKSFLDRLMLDEKRIGDMAEGLRLLADIADPVGIIENTWQGAQGIEITKIRVPLGVIGIIYEARPNVTADAAGICLKTGNAVILRGGSDAIHSNIAIVGILREAIGALGIDMNSIQILEDTSREKAREMMCLNEYIDVLIPRGGAGLIASVVREASVPVIETGAGNCHAYVEKTADFAKAIEIIINGKVQRPAVCNALESMLVDEAIAGEFLPIIEAELGKHGVEIRGCEKVCAILAGAVPACAEDFSREYNDLIISIKVVNDTVEAISHINNNGTRHSEVIITEDEVAAGMFRAGVDAAAVYTNVSTRFTDGFQFGFGAEIGISTQKLHARGPMGLYEMTSYKYLINGEGQVRK